LCIHACASPGAVDKGVTEVLRGNLRLLLAGPQSSAGRPMPDGHKPEPGGWNRIHFVVDDPLRTKNERVRPIRVRTSEPDH
jgi:hypothetical protein